MTQTSRKGVKNFTLPRTSFTLTQRQKLKPLTRKRRAPSTQRCITRGRRRMGRSPVPTKGLRSLQPSRRKTPRLLRRRSLHKTRLTGQCTQTLAPRLAKIGSWQGTNTRKSGVVSIRHLGPCSASPHENLRPKIKRSHRGLTSRNPSMPGEPVCGASMKGSITGACRNRSCCLAAAALHSSMGTCVGTNRMPPPSTA